MFAELKSKVIDREERQDQRSINRYATGSSRSVSQGVNWSITLKLTASNPRGGALMHGPTDSSYVIRALGEHLSKRGTS